MPDMKHALDQRGAAALPITLMLAIAVLLAVAFANRSVVLQVRTSIHQLHTAQAQEAAQAALAWTLAQLNRQTPLDESCQAASGAEPWHVRVQEGPLQASCVAQGDGWSCHCPRDGEPRATEGTAFRIQLTPDETQPDRWQLTSTGHGSAPGRGVTLRTAIGRLPALATQPAAALTVRGAARFDGQVTLTNTDPAGSGVTLHAGGNVHGPELRAISMAGTPAAASILGDEPALADASATGLHASVFRMDRSAWREQPGTAVVDCRSPCDEALAAAARQHTMIVVDGGLRLTTALAVGTAGHPVVLVVEGPVALDAAATIHGLLYLRDTRWHDALGTTVRGAVIAESGLHLQGTATFHHDADVLRALQRRSGTYAPVAGSWRDL